jgi:Domain of unknown function (DUF955).
MSDYQERKEEAEEQMTEAILKIGQNEEAWKKWVEFRSRFHDYSFMNRLMIAAEDPDAQQVMGYRDWQENGRQVAGGEKGLKIWYPRTTTADDEEEAEEAGVEVGEEYVYGFGIGKVFAWNQTIPIVGRPAEEVDWEEDAASIERVDNDDATTAAEAGTESLPEPVPTLDGSSHRALFEAATQYAEQRGNRVTTLSVGHQQRGDYSVDNLNGTGRIRYREDLSPNAAASTVTHELAHALTFERYSEDELKDIGKSGLEIVAEGASYMACYMLGLDTAQASFPYLRSWSEGGNLDPDEEEDEEKIQEAIRSHLKAIGSIADDLRDGVLDVLDESEARELVHA